MQRFLPIEQEPVNRAGTCGVLIRSKVCFWLLMMAMVFPAQSQVLFSTVSYPTTNRHAYDIAMADFNGDGRPDIAVCHFDWTTWDQNGVSVLLNDGHGGYGPASAFGQHIRVRDLHVGDLNRDGHPDIVAVGNDPNVADQMLILMNDGNGGFSTTIHATEGIDAVWISDMNNDGWPDVVKIGQDYHVSVLLNNGDGTQASGDDYAVDFGRQLAVGDLNGDGYADIAVTNGALNNISVLLNNGDGTFAAQVTYPVGNYAHYVAIVDLDGDGTNDLVVSNRNEKTLSVLMNTGSGLFAGHAVYPVGDNPNRPVVGDLNGDGYPDIAVANSNDGTVSILQNDGDGTFARTHTRRVPGGASTVWMADLNEDGRIDLAVTQWAGVTGLLNGGFVPDADNIVYVNQDVDQGVAGYTGNGSSWENAIPELADALMLAQVNADVWTADRPLRVWAAAGTYTPLYSHEEFGFGTSADRKNSFVMVPNVQVYGGFAGTETTLAQRNWALHQTVLSGEMQADNDHENNAYHVVIAAGDVGAALLDGVVVERGSPINDGGASQSRVNGEEIVNRVCGGIYNVRSAIRISNTVIRRNLGCHTGGFRNEFGSPTLLNVAIIDNSGSDAYALTSHSGTTKLINTTLAGNDMPGIIHAPGITIQNSILTNHPDHSPSTELTGADISHSIVAGYTAGGSVLNLNPRFNDPENGDYSLAPTSKAVNSGSNQHYVDAGGDSASDWDLAGQPRVFGHATGGIVDMGAYEYQGTAQRPFVTTWKTDNPGTSANNEILIPTNGLGYLYDVYWEDVDDPEVSGSVSGVTGSPTLTFPRAGTYRVEITGDFPHLMFGNTLVGGDSEKILSVEQWGDIKWASMDRTFARAKNLVSNATDAPDLSGVSDFDYMFVGAESFDADLSGWNVSNATTMVGMFSSATQFNGDISGWDVSNVTSMFTMFSNAIAFNGDIGGWNVSNVADMFMMFGGALAFDRDLGGWDISRVTNAGDMLNNAGLSTENYDATLIGWAARSGLPKQLSLGALNLTYCAGAEARQSLIDDHGWTISNDSPACGSMVVFVRRESGSTLVIRTDGSDAIQQVKQRIDDQIGVPSHLQRLFFEGEELEDGRTLADYGIANGNTLDLMANTPPTVANPIPDQEAIQDTPFSFQFAEDAFDDVDADDVLSFSAMLTGGEPLPDWLDFDMDTRTFSGTPEQPDVGVLAIAITAHDGNGGTVTDTFTLTVAPRPSVVVSTEVSSPVNAPFTVTVAFSEPVTEFTTADFVLTNATVSDLVTSDNIGFTAVVTPGAGGVVQVSVPADAAVNQVGIGNTASNSLEVQYNMLITGITLDGVLVAYDGTTKPLIITGDLPEGTTVSYTIDDEPGNSARDAGTYMVIAYIDGGANYEDLELTATLTIAPLGITVTAEDNTKVFGAADPALTYTHAPALMGEDAFSGALSRAPGHDVGEYAITQGDLTAGDNYAITFFGGTLTITPAGYDGIALNNALFTYDGTPRTLGLIGDLPEGVSVTYTIDDEPGNSARDAGTYAVIAYIDGGANYDDLELMATLTIAPLAVTVTAEDKTKVYGTSDPVLTYAHTPGLIGDDAFTGALSRVPGSDVGDYEITQGNLRAGDNYAITFVEGALTITLAERTINFLSIPEKNYGDDDFDVDAVVSSGEELNFVSSNLDVAEIVNGRIRIIGAGRTVITVSVPENPRYGDGVSASRILVVHRATQEIMLQGPAEVHRDVGSIELNASVSSGLPVMLALDNPRVAELDGMELHILRMGAVTIKATQLGDENHEAADSVTLTIHVVDPLSDLPVRVHPVVSPNGDGINEFLMIEAITAYPENRVTIFNRNGTLLWEASGYDNNRIAFRGISTGQLLLPAGTYFYIVEINDNGLWKHKKGYFVLKY